MKATLEFDLNEESEEFEMCMKATKMSCALSDISNHIFRPARKHGYNDEKLVKLIEKNKDAEFIIGLLEEKFIEILNAYGLQC